MAVALPPDGFRTEVAEIRGPGSTCAVRWKQWDRNDPEPIYVDCGRRRVLLDREYHGFVATKLRPCHAMIMLPGILRPVLHSVDNCAGRLRKTNLSLRWESDLARKAKVPLSQFESVLYESKKGRPGCYHINAGYLPPGVKEGSFLTITGDYCAPKAKP